MRVEHGLGQDGSNGDAEKWSCFRSESTANRTHGQIGCRQVEGHELW